MSYAVLESLELLIAKAVLAGNVEKARSWALDLAVARDSMLTRAERRSLD